jgi:formylglycine-generating enzyme required for sulfatase activity
MLPTRTADSEPPGDDDLVQNDTPMVYVPGGMFSMGSDQAANESPIHEVTLDPYYIDQYEVTNASYASCVEDGACPPPGSTTAYDSTPYYGVDDYRKYPVVYVSWYSADEYCQWRGAQLPTEAEWEMAARWNPAAESALVYPWGDDWDHARLNYCDASCLINDPLLVDETFFDGYPQMAPVGTFPEGSSPAGAHDMAGNVAEWVYDWYAADYYSISPDNNPTGPESGSSRVVRGGGWSLDWFRNRTTARLPWGPRSEVAGIGFRCAISADAVNP